jgi:hypothetical protein
MSTTTNRRRFLSFAASGAAAAALLAAPALAAGVSAAPVTPDPVAALGRKWRVAYKRMQKAWNAIETAECAIRDRGERVPSYPSTTVGNQWCGSVAMILATCRQPGGPGEEETRELVAEFRRRVRAYYQQRRAMGLRPLDLNAREESKGERALMDAIAKTPATSFAGIAAKLYAIRDDFRDGISDFSGAILRSALRDAERLAKGGAA